MTRTLVTRLLALTPAVLAAGAALGQPGAGRLYIIPDLPHSPVINAENAVRAVADNGVCAASGADLNSQWYGGIFDDTSFQAVRYDPAVGEAVALGKFVSAFNSSTCYAITPDGTQLFGASTIARSGNGSHNSRAMRWSAADGMVQLPIITGDPEDSTFSIINAATVDGGLLVGSCGPSTNNRWAAWPVGAGLPPFQFPDATHDVPGGIVGVSDDTNTVFGTSGVNARAFIWTRGATAFTALALPNANNSNAIAMTPDGQTFAGASDTIYNGQHVGHVFRYRADTGVVDLSAGLFPAEYHNCQGMSGDGTIVLGLYSAPLPQGVPAWQGYGVGWIWRQGRGVEPIETYFTQELGLSLRGLLHTVPYAISRDGRWIACQAKDPTEQELFISFVVDTRPPVCGSADFNCDGDSGTDADIEAFFACIAGSCPPPPCASSADFNGDGDVGTDADIEAFFRVLAGGTC